MTAKYSAKRERSRKGIQWVGEINVENQGNLTGHAEAARVLLVTGVRKRKPASEG